MYLYLETQCHVLTGLVVYQPWLDTTAPYTVSENLIVAFTHTYVLAYSNLVAQECGEGRGHTWPHLLYVPCCVNNCMHTCYWMLTQQVAVGKGEHVMYTRARPCLVSVPDPNQPQRRSLTVASLLVSHA